MSQPEYPTHPWTLEYPDPRFAEIILSRNEILHLLHQIGCWPKGIEKKISGGGALVWDGYEGKLELRVGNEVIPIPERWQGFARRLVFPQYSSEAGGEPAYRKEREGGGCR